jgi:hypothetical protein
MCLMPKLGRYIIRLSFVILAGILAAGCGEARSDEQQSVFEQQVRKIAKLLDYRDGTRIEMVTVNGKPAHSAVLRRTSWQLKGVSQIKDLDWEKKFADAMKLSEAERLKRMNRDDDHIELWAVAKALSNDKGGLVPADVSHRYHRELFYLGEYKGFAWYGFMTIYDFVEVEQKLALKGEDILSTLIRGATIEDSGSCTRNSCESRLGMLGVGAIKAVDKAIADRLPQRSRLVKAMVIARNEAVTLWLVELANSADAVVGEAARWTLLASPRKEAAHLYLRWLAEGTGKREVYRELWACRELKLTVDPASLARVLAAPASVIEYRLGLGMSHEFAGLPAVPATLLAAEKEILQSSYHGRPEVEQMAIIERAVHTLLAAGDPEDAAAIGMSLAVYTSKGGPGNMRVAGIRILRGLPGGEGKRLARLLAKTNRQEFGTREIQDIAAAMDE